MRDLIQPLVNGEAMISRGAGSRLVLVLLTLSLPIYLTVVFMLGPLLAQLAWEFDTSVAITGQLASATFMAWGVGAILTAPLSDSFGRRPVLLVALFLTAALVALSGIAWNYSSLLVLRVITALVASALPTTTMAAIIDLLPPQSRPRGLAVVSSTVMLGPLFGVPAVSLVADILGWRGPFFAISAALVIIMIGAFLTVPKQPQDETERSSGFFSHREAYVALSKRLDLWLVLIGNLVLRANSAVIITYMAAFLIASHALDEGQVALPLALVSLGLVIGSLTGGEVSRNRWCLLILALTFTMAGLTGTFLFESTLNTWVSVGMGFSVGALTHLAMPTFLNIVARVSGEHRSSAMGLFVVTNQWGSLLGAAPGGLILAKGGYGPLGFLLLGMALAGSAVCLVLWRRQNSEHRRQTPYNLRSVEDG